MSTSPSSQRPERPPARGKRKLPPTEEEPQWYLPPPEKPPLGDRLRELLPRLIFPLAVLLFGTAVAVLLYMDPFTLRESSTSPEPTLSERAQALEQPLQGSPAGGETAAVSLTTEPGGVTILVDGDSVGVSPLTNHRMAGGAYIVSFDHERYFRRDTLIVVDGGSTPSFNFRMRSQDPSEQFAWQQGGVSEQAPPPQQTPQQQPTPQNEAATEPEPEPALGTLIISSQPDGATVEIDGEEVGSTPLSLDRPPGTYDIRVRQEGYRAYESAMEVTSGDTRTQVASLEALTGTLRILPRPWGSVYINGELRVSETNARYTTELPVGTHMVEVRHPSLGRQQQEVTVSPDESTSIEVDLRTSDNEDEGR